MQDLLLLIITAAVFAFAYLAALIAHGAFRSGRSLNAGKTHASRRRRRRRKKSAPNLSIPYWKNTASCDTIQEQQGGGSDEATTRP